jgi:hypothetical protein
VNAIDGMDLILNFCFHSTTYFTSRPINLLNEELKDILSNNAHGTTQKEITMTFNSIETNNNSKLLHLSHQDAFK